jgi:hypothetical protein
VAPSAGPEFKPQYCKKEKKKKRNATRAGHGGTCLKSQHSEGRGRRILSSRATWAIQLDAVSKTKARGEGGEMTQTLYAHMNKKKKAMEKFLLSHVNPM